MQSENASKLLEFVEASKTKGASDEFLTSLLIHQGWPEEEVFATLGTYWAQISGVPVPERTGRGESARDGFLYLLSFATLATWSTAFGSLMFRFIENWFPDPVVTPGIYNLRNALTWQMASIAVAFPIFVLAMSAILREVRSDPERLRSGVRKWLTYIAMLLTAAGVITDLICFLDYFLKGELTTPFLLKTMTVLVICGAIFVYYLGSLRWGKDVGLEQAKRRSLQFGVGCVIALVATFWIGMYMAGTPSKQRQIEADNKRVQDLRAIAFAIEARYKTTDSDLATRRLPGGILELQGHGIRASQAMDPETKNVYEYRTLSAKDYEVCGVFAEATEPNQMGQSGFWSHPKGRTCFTLDATLTPAW